MKEEAGVLLQLSIAFAWRKVGTMIHVVLHFACRIDLVYFMFAEIVLYCGCVYVEIDLVSFLACERTLCKSFLDFPCSFVCVLSNGCEASLTLGREEMLG